MKKKPLSFGVNLSSTLQSLTVDQLWDVLQAELHRTPPRLAMYQRIVSRLKDAVAKNVEKEAMAMLARRMKR
jgi:hypothetical protein